MIQNIRFTFNCGVHDGCEVIGIGKTSKFKVIAHSFQLKISLEICRIAVDNFKLNELEITYKRNVPSRLSPYWQLVNLGTRCTVTHC